MKQYSGRIIFFLTTVVIYAGFAFFNPTVFHAASLSFINMIKKVLPVLVIVIAIMALVDMFFGKEKIEKYFGDTSGVKGWFAVILAAFLNPTPPYLLFPLLKDMKKKGMRNRFLAALLFNRSAQASYIPIMIYFFGWIYTLVLTFYMVVFSVVNGIVVGKLTEEK